MVAAAVDVGVRVGEHPRKAPLALGEPVVYQIALGHLAYDGEHEAPFGFSCLARRRVKGEAHLDFDLLALLAHSRDLQQPLGVEVGSPPQLSITGCRSPVSLL